VNIRSSVAGIAAVGILVFLALSFYSCYLRFTTQDEYFGWLWNCSPQVQYVTGWALAIGFISACLLASINSKGE